MTKTMFGTISLMLALTLPGRSAGLDQLKTGFMNPTAEYRPIPMDFDQSDPGKSGEELKQGAWGGALFNYPHGGPTYLSDQAGWDSFEASVRACREKGLLVWIYDEMGYPSGRAGGLVLKDHPEYDAQGLFYDSTDFAVGKEPREIEWRIPEGKPYYVGVGGVDWAGHVDAENATDVTDKARDGVLHLELEPGVWRIMAFVQNRLYEGTHGPITFGQMPNLMDPDAVRRFIEITYDGYYARCGDQFGKEIRAIFTDEPSLQGGFLTQDIQPHPTLNWWGGLPEMFQRRNGYDIRKALPAMFNPAGPETARMRCDYYSTMAQAVGDAYFGQIGDWCRAHKIAFTGHLVWEESLIYHCNFYGSVFPSLAQMDWPGIDVLGCGYGCTSGAHTEGGPVTPKLISSAAHIYGKKRTMSESFCFVTGKTPIEELMAHVNWQWVLGINSLVTLSIQNAYPPETLKRLNDYTGRLSFMLTQGKPVIETAVLYPIASAWADFHPTNRHVSYLEDNPKAKDVDDAWREASKEVLACRRDFDYLDEDALGKAQVSGGKIRIGQCAYSVLVLPHVTTLKYSSLQKIAKFAASGGKVISYGAVPVNREDAGPADEFHALVERLWDGGKVVQVATLGALGKALGRPDVQISPETREVYYQHRALAGGDVYFLVNNSKEPVSGTFSFRAQGKPQVWDPSTGETRVVKATGPLKLSLKPRSGLFVVFGK